MNHARDARRHVAGQHSAAHTHRNWYYYMPSLFTWPSRRKKTIRAIPVSRKRIRRKGGNNERSPSRARTGENTQTRSDRSAREVVLITSRDPPRGINRTWRYTVYLRDLYEKISFRKKLKRNAPSSHALLHRNKLGARMCRCKKMYQQYLLCVFILVHFCTFIPSHFRLSAVLLTSTTRVFSHPGAIRVT